MAAMVPELPGNWRPPVPPAPPAPRGAPLALGVAVVGVDADEEPQAASARPATPRAESASARRRRPGRCCCVLTGSTGPLARVEEVGVSFMVGLLESFGG
jgi:hypothetical protein